MSGSLNDALRVAFGAHAGAIAIHAQDGQHIPFSRLAEIADAFAHRLIDEGVAPGAQILPMVDNTAVKIALILAILRVGAVPIMANTPAGLAKAGVRVDHVVALPDQLTDGLPTLVFGQGWDRPPDAELPDHPARGLIFGSSGSTGAPKFLFRSADSLLSLVAHRQAHAGVVAGSVLLGMGVTTQVSFQVMIAAFLQGFAVTFPLSSPALTLTRMAENGITDAMVAPIFLDRLVAAADQADTLPVIYRLVVGGAAARPDLLARAQEVFGSAPICLMGSTEAGLTGGDAWPGPDTPQGYLGPLADGVEVQLRDTSGQVVDPGQEGRLLLRPPTTHRVDTYLDGRPILDADGWFSTGDIARLSPDNMLTILGRDDDRLSVGGVKLDPLDIEALFFDLAGTRRIAVTTDGQRLCLIIEGIRDPSDATIKTRAALRLAQNIQLSVTHVPKLPETSSGKLDRKALPALVQSED